MKKKLTEGEEFNKSSLNARNFFGDEHVDSIFAKIEKMEEVNLKKPPETTEQMMKDSDMIFTQMTTSIFNYEEVKRFLVSVYVTDLTISRAGISHAMKRLEEYYSEPTNH